VRLERESQSHIDHEVWAVLTAAEAFQLMRDLEEYFAVGPSFAGWHTHIGESDDSSGLSIGVEEVEQVPRGDAPAEVWSGQDSDAQKLITADEHFAALESEDPVLRSVVIRRLRIRERDDSRTLPTILASLQSDPSPLVRSEAATQLAEYEGDERVIPALRMALAFDPAGEVRFEASSRLIYLGEDYP
jgi:hypothetical protein